MRKLLWYQVQASDYLVERAKARKGAYLYMEMRTGKTLATIRGLIKMDMQGVHYPWPLLVVAPKSVLATWSSELEREGFDREMIAVCDKTVPKARSLLHQGKHSIYLVNYDKLVRTKALRAQEWQTVVFDESIKVANLGAKVTKEALSSRTDSYQLRIALSGAPAGEGYLQLVTPALICGGEFCGAGDYYSYMSRDWRYNEYRYDWVPRSKETNRTIERWLESETYRLTREQAGVGSVKLYGTQVMEPSAWQEQAFADLWSRTTYASREGKILEFNALSHSSFEHQVANGIDWRTGELVDRTKVTAICEYILELGEPVLVFGRFVVQLQAIAEELGRMGLERWYIDGSIPTGDRDEIRKAFQGQGKGKPCALVAQVVPVKMGIDLSNAHTIIYASSTFSHDDRAQSEDRATHIMKDEPVQIMDFVTRGTMEPELYATLEQKKSWNRQAMETYHERGHQ